MRPLPGCQSAYIGSVVGQGKGTFGPEPGDWAPPVPAAIFLDTSIVIDLDTYGEQIWDGVAIPTTLAEQLRRQIEALTTLMALASRAGLAFAVSSEVIREAHGRYVLDIAEHWQEGREALGIADRGLPPMTLVSDLPRKDQLVLAQAYRSGCEVVLTNDLRWMRRTHRRTISALGVEAHTPETLVAALRPWLALWL